MALTIEDLRKKKDGARYVSPQRLYVTAEDELCAAGDPAAVKLLVGEGGVIPNALAAKYGLIAGAEPKPEGLAALTVAEVRERADEQGVELPGRATKADIIVALEANKPDAEGSKDGDE